MDEDRGDRRSGGGDPIGVPEHGVAQPGGERQCCLELDWLYEPDAPPKRGARWYWRGELLPATAWASGKPHRKAKLALIGSRKPGHGVRYANSRHYDMVRRRLTREQKRAETRGRLLAAAAKVFATKGFHGASVDGIAEEAGFTTGALYYNFGGKEDLFLALFEEHVAERVGAYSEAFGRGHTLEEQARRGADDWIAYIGRSPEFFQLFIEFWAYATRDPKLRRRFAARFGAFPEAIARMIEEAARQRGIELPPGAAERLGTVVNALGNGLALEKLANPDAVPDDLFGLTLWHLFESLSGSTSQRVGDRRTASSQGRTSGGS
jgi:AcrR family transcriptional regulator